MQANRPAALSHNMDDTDTQLDAVMQERFTKLPKVVQDAITSADVQKHLQELAKTHKLHLDQWTTLENEVMMVLLGIESTSAMQANIQKEVGVDAETATALANDISGIVFAPIRQELERQLDHPAAQEEIKTDTEQVREQMLAANAQPTGAAAVVAQTPAAPAVETKPVGDAATPVIGTPANTPVVAPVTREPISETYKPGEASSDRKTVHDDPYRESPV